MLSCKGHLEHLYDRPGQEFDKFLRDGEGDAEVDTGSEWGPQHVFELASTRDELEEGRSWRGDHEEGRRSTTHE